MVLHNDYLEISHLRYIPCISNIGYLLGQNVPFWAQTWGVNIQLFSKNSPDMLWKGRHSV